MFLTKKKFEEMVQKRIEEQMMRNSFEREMREMRRDVYEMTDKINMRMNILESRFEQHIHPVNPAGEKTAITNDCVRY